MSEGDLKKDAASSESGNGSPDDPSTVRPAATKRSPSSGSNPRLTSPVPAATPPSPRKPSGKHAPYRPRFRTGDVLAGRFQIVKFLARGGMGEVYEAHDLELREPVALKTIRADIAEDESAMDRFRREIHLARRVTHPNVCRLFDLFHHTDPADPDEPVRFVTMELLEGQTLSARLREGGPFSTADALPVVTQMTAGLEAAHRAGIVHRDFKAANVFLDRATEAGGGLRAVITDFGIARSVAAGGGSMAGTLTSSGALLGTPAYMAPEQVDGGPITPAVDVYALGVVLFEMVTGKRPFAGDSEMSTAMKRLKEPAPAPHVYKTDIDAKWDATILRCLERRPEDRFACATDVSRALEGEYVQHGTRERARRKRARGAVLAALLVLAALAGVLGGRFLKRKGTGVSTSLSPVQLTTSAGLDLFPAFSPDGNSLAYSSDRSGGFEIYVKPLTPGGREMALTSDGQQNFEPAYSPDGERIAYFSKNRGGIWIVPAFGGVPRQLTDFGSRPTFSPDGKSIAFQSAPLSDLAASSVVASLPSTIWAIPASGGVPREITRSGTPHGSHSSPFYSPDGKRLLFVSGSAYAASIWSVPAEGGDPTALAQKLPLSYDPVVAGDGSTLFYCGISPGWTYGLYRQRLDPKKGTPAGEAVPIANVGFGPIRQLAISRDGKRIAYGNSAMTSNLWSVPIAKETGEPAGAARPLSAETGRTTRAAYSPDGKRLAFNKWRRGATEDVWVSDADGGNAVEVSNGTSDCYLPTWFPDGKRVAYISTRNGEKAVYALDVASRKESRIANVPASYEFP
ncbi:MAG TPA: protein kinase, partial [Thermoanaerobaculia bacterium]|nr:protein kinase [Thermoanaerobaculia bacterium]